MLVFVTKDLQRIRGRLRQKRPRQRFLDQKPGARLALLKKYEGLVLECPYFTFLGVCLYRNTPPALQ